MDNDDFPASTYAETKNSSSSGIVSLLIPGATSSSNPILSSGVPAGQTVTVLNIGRDKIAIGIGGYLVPKNI